MARLTTYTFARGATIKLGLSIEDGQVNAVTGVVARLRRLPDDGSTDLSPTTPVAADFFVTERQAEGSIPAGWNLMIPAATSAGLTVGAYLADARFGVGTGFEFSSQIRIEIYEPATIG